MLALSDQTGVEVHKTVAFRKSHMINNNILNLIYTDHNHRQVYSHVVCVFHHVHHVTFMFHHVRYKVKCSCVSANFSLTLWRAGRARSRSDTAPGVAACPLALELRGTTRPFRPLT